MNDSGIICRELQREEIDRKMVRDINRLLPQLSSSPRTVTQAWLNRMFKSGTRLFAAFDEGTIIGTVLLCPMVIFMGQEDWIHDVVVDEAYRGQGISSELMGMAERASWDREAKSVNLTSKPDRNGARKMYGNRGYALRETGVFRLTF